MAVTHYQKQAEIINGERVQIKDKAHCGLWWVKTTNNKSEVTCKTCIKRLRRER